MKTDTNSNRAEVKRFAAGQTMVGAWMKPHDDQTPPAARLIVAAAAVRDDR
jgi:hypothetical protein